MKVFGYMVFCWVPQIQCNFFIEIFIQQVPTIQVDKISIPPQWRDEHLYCVELERLGRELHFLTIGNNNLFPPRNFKMVAGKEVNLPLGYRIAIHGFNTTGDWEKVIRQI